MFLTLSLKEGKERMHFLHKFLKNISMLSWIPMSNIKVFSLLSCIRIFIFLTSKTKTRVQERERETETESSAKMLGLLV